MKRKLLLGAAAALLLLVMPFLVLKVWDAPLERRAAPLCGT